MKKRKTRKQKRSLKQKINSLKTITGILKQYFPQFTTMLNKLTDKRHRSYIKYNMSVITIVRLMGYLSGLNSLNEMTRAFDSDEVVKNIAEILNVEIEEVPHYDTINDVFKNIEINEIRKIIKYLITSMIRSKMLDKYRHFDKYFQIVVDGTGLVSFKNKHCEHCLKRKYKDKETGEESYIYFHYVLEAKLVVGNMVFSIDSEFIENVDNYEKQDCELNAFKRMATRIKKEYPRLSIIISGDALYACKTIADICEDNKWMYVNRFKKDRIKTLGTNIDGLEKISNKIKLEENSSYRYWNKVHSGSAVKNNEGTEYNVIEFYENKKNKRNELVEVEFIWITSFEIKENNIKTLVEIGRKRWKIENEGFNEQKNGTFDISHLYSRNKNAMKVHYLFIQIAHIIRQLFENGVKELQELKLKKVEISKMLLQSLTSKQNDLNKTNEKFYFKLE